MKEFAKNVFNRASPIQIFSRLRILEKLNVNKNTKVFVGIRGQNLVCNQYFYSKLEIRIVTFNVKINITESKKFNT